MTRAHLAARRAALDDLVAAQFGLVTAAQLRELGFDHGSVTHRLAGSEIWRRLLPGIYLTHRGTPDDHQRRLAALLYAGPDAVLTGLAALTLHGSRVAARKEGAGALVLVPHHRQRSTSGFVTVERTTRMPPSVVRSGLAVAPADRAALDSARRMTDLGDVRALLSDVVQSGLAHPVDLERQLRESQRRGTRLARLAITALIDGTRSAPEAELRDAWLASAVRPPLWNPTLTTRGAFLARPDAYVVKAGLAIEVESQEFHYAASDWRRTIERQTKMTSEGIVVLQVTPRRLREARHAVMREVERTLAALGVRPLPHIQVHAG